MRIGLTIDCDDPDRLASFWAVFTGYRCRSGAGGNGPYVTIDRPDGVDGPPHITFQRVPEAKTVKVRIHLDLFVDHAEPVVSEMIESGARLVERTEAGAWTTRIMQDPAGNEFCVVGPD